jgi:hypothetical protein
MQPSTAADRQDRLRGVRGPAQTRRKSGQNGRGGDRLSGWQDKVLKKLGSTSPARASGSSTVGVLRRQECGITEIGVLWRRGGADTSTNPTSTVMFKRLICLRRAMQSSSRNGRKGLHSGDSGIVIQGGKGSRARTE